MHAFPDLLGVDDLPAVELHAAARDGELYALGDGWAPIDLIASPPVRLAAVLHGRSDRLIADGPTAAWVWGAPVPAPAFWHLCVSAGERIHRSPALRGIRVREVVLDAEDVVDVGGHRVTSPLRTAVDLARSAAPPDPEVFRALAELGGFGLDDARRLMDRRRNLPDKRRAHALLAGALETEIGAVTQTR